METNITGSGPMASNHKRGQGSLRTIESAGVEGRGGIIPFFFLSIEGKNVVPAHN
jgi:hypothetical protein